MFAEDQDNATVTKELRVSVRSVQRWRRSWQEGGRQTLHSKGSAARPKLNEDLSAVLEQELAEGSVAHGWPDRTWTLARIRTLIGRRLHRTLTLSAIARMLRVDLRRGSRFASDATGGE